MTEMLVDRPAGKAAARFLFAHGAGAPMDSEFMQAIAAGLCARGIEVLRFEFPYMAERRSGGGKRPPNKMEVLLDCYREQILELAAERERLPLFIGGKSLGGRVASLLATDEYRQGRIGGLVCLGYPFHPRGKPEKLRTGHLYSLECPALFVQGTRDPLGNFDEVAAYRLPDSIRFEWLADGDHDFKSRRASGFSREQHWQAAATAAADFVTSVIK
ncbi:alpha/beta fold hydrolase [Microbulbifer sp.]|uniref:alpha/beta fold hydrolase n=1 Tax=Microbulbifer sp. TaxID=1908541 RepID=UPI003F3581B0